MSDPIRPSLPRPQPSSNAGSSNDTDARAAEASPTVPEVDPDDVPASYREAVEALTEQVAAAAETIDRLAAENRRLKQRVRDLEQRPDVPEGHTAVPLEEDREALRRRIDGFIASIDAYLDEEPDDSRTHEAVADAEARTEAETDERAGEPTGESDSSEGTAGPDRPARAGDAPDSSEAARPNSVTWDIRS